MKRTLVLLAVVLFTGLLMAQESYWVFFSDKDGVNFNPYDYFTHKAIDRRMKLNIPLDAWSDRPVREDYLQQVAELSDTILWVSRWFNAAVIITDDQRLDAIEQLPFVRSIKLEQVMTANLTSVTEISDDVLDESDERLLDEQTAVLGREAFNKAGFDGSGVTVAIFDAGFPSVDTHPAFEHIRSAGHILKTWDFCKNKAFVYAYAEHGTEVMSCIAGKWHGKQIGLATGASFLLARTEYGRREPFSEERHWMAAAEWADKNGADIISSSLGYTEKRYFQEQMDGHTSLVVRAAEMAASKGILVINAAGNEGDGEWRVLDTPADGDSVLTVGGIDPSTGLRISFTSYGPTADHRMKPNVAAYGKVVAANEKGGVSVVYGTSFATPLTSGFAACALQSMPNTSNMELFHAIERSASLYPYFDYLHGYGTPRAEYFTGRPDVEPPVTFDVNEDDFTYKITIRDAYLNAGSDEYPTLDEAVDDMNDNKDYFYYHIENNKGYLDHYYVLDVYQSDVLTLHKDELGNATVIRMYYKGYTKEIRIAR